MDVSGGSSTTARSGGALPELVSLLLSTPSVEDYLFDLAGIAAREITGDRLSCGITLLRDHRTLTVASSDDLALAVDEAQYSIGAGPCLESMTTGEIFSIPDLSSERRWGGYTAHALAHGVASSLSVPLIAEESTVGALNLYATWPRAFDWAGVVAQATTLAAQGSAVLTVVLRQARQARLTEQLREALASRTVIDQAVGIIMAQQRCRASEAFDYLRAASQNRNRKLWDVAADIINSVSGAPPESARFTEPPR